MDTKGAPWRRQVAPFSGGSAPFVAPPDRRQEKRNKFSQMKKLSCLKELPRPMCGGLPVQGYRRDAGHEGDVCEPYQSPFVNIPES